MCKKHILLAVFSLAIMTAYSFSLYAAEPAVLSEIQGPNEPITDPENPFYSTPEETLSQQPETSLPETRLTEKHSLSRFTEGEYIFRLVLDGQTIASGILMRAQDSRGYLSLTDLTAALQFGIDVDAEDGIASGFYIDEARSFHMDLNTLEVKSGDVSYTITPEDFIRDDDIYLELGFLTNIFPLDFQINEARLDIRIIPLETLPGQAEAERSRSCGNIRRNLVKKPELPPTYETPSLIDWPSVDINILQDLSNLVQSRESSAGLNSNYTVRAYGDVLMHSGRLFVTGNDEDPLRTVRATLERVDPDGGLLGVANANRYAIGDVSGVNFPIIANTGEERGFIIQRQNLRGSSSANRTTVFTGDAQPGWEVELYRNGVLLEFRDVGDNGLYEFLDVPLVLGRNEFELRFYGPQGQRRTEQEVLFLGPGFVERGNLNYQVSVQQQEINLLKQDENVDLREEGEINASILLDYGITETLSGSLGVNTRQFNEKRKTYYALGLSGSVRGSLAEINLLSDESGGYAVEGSLRTRFAASSINLSQTFLQDFEAEGYGAGRDAVVSRTEVGLNTRIPLTSSLIMPFRLNTVYDVFDDRDSSLRINNNFGLSFDGVNLAHNLFANFFDDSDNRRQDIINGVFQADATRSWYYIKPRIRLTYGISPVQELQTLSLSNTFPLTDELSLAASIRKNFGSLGDTETYSLSLNYDNGLFAIFPQVTVNSQGNLTALIGFRTSITPDPYGDYASFSSDLIAQQSKIAARAYHDTNLNGLFDEGEEPLQYISVSTPHSGQAQATDPDGLVLMRRIVPYRATDVLVDERQIADPGFAPSYRGNSILPRPGKVFTFDFPIVSVGEVDGYVWRQREDGSNDGFGGAIIRLYNERGEVVSETSSAFDGFYQLTRIRPGAYMIEARKMNRVIFRRFLQPQPQVLRITTEGEVYSGVDFTFERRAEEIDIPADWQPPEDLTADEIAAIIALGPTLEPGETYSVAGLPQTLPQTPPPQSQSPAAGAAYGPALPADQTASGAPAAAPALPVITLQKNPDTSVTGYHLASFFSLKRAETGWQIFQRDYPELVKNFTPLYRRIHLPRAGGTFYRLIILPQDVSDAESSPCPQFIAAELYCRAIHIRNPGQKLPPPGTTGYHLASYARFDTAEQAFKELQSQHPALKEFLPAYRRTIFGGRTFMRVIAVDPEGRERRDLCPQLKEKGQYCNRVELEEDADYQ